jgi:hypothetical protein
MRRLTQSPPNRGGADGVLESAEQAHREVLRLMQAGDWRTADCAPQLFESAAIQLDATRGMIEQC